MTVETNVKGTGVQIVPIRSGPPTMKELRVHYPARFTWSQLKTFVNSGYVLFSTIVELFHDNL